MTERPDPWDDARLTAAFTARAARAGEAPADLADAVVASLDPRRARPVSRVRPWLAAAAAVVALVGFAGVRVLTQGDGPGFASSSPGGPSASPAIELSPITVVDAMGVRASGSDRELLVAGFLSPMPVLGCPMIPATMNPTRIHCPQTFQWLMERPEVLMTIGPSSSSGGPPTGPAFHPSFALVDPPNVPFPAQGAARPAPVMLIGHFHDRRTALCEDDPLLQETTSCGDVFIVDRVVSINGEVRPVATRLDNVRFDDATQQQVTLQPIDLQEDVDGLVLSIVRHGSVLSRQLVTIGQVIGIEPILAKDDVIPHMGNPATLIWFVTVLDPSGDVPIARTFALMDGSNWFAEMTAKGAAMLERQKTGVPSKTPAVVPSADPTAFDSAPASVLGITVRDIATLERDRRADFGDLGRDEFAVRAWYVGPDPAAPCEPASPTIQPPTPPCDAARHWLLDRPEQLATEVGQLRTNSDHWPPVLNPLLPIDVPFDFTATWVDGVPMPQPVIVLGHFEDMRVHTYAGNLYFVIDALAWRPDRPSQSVDSLTRLSTTATEDPAAVLARVERLAGTAAVATWATVVDASDFAALDPRAAEVMPEFTSGRPVWVVRRLVENEIDGRQRLAVERAFTADDGERTWITPSPDQEPDLATTLDLLDLDPRTNEVRVYDYDRQIASVATTAGLGTLSWRRAGPNPLVALDVARGNSDRDVAIRWTGSGCAPIWRVRVQTLSDGKILVEPSMSGDTCDKDSVTRRILIRFDHPVDLDRIRTGDPCCG